MKNAWGIVGIVAVLAVGAVLTACNITDPNSWPNQVKVPTALREPGQPHSLSVNEAESDFRVRMAAMEVYAEQIANGKVRADAWRSVLHNLAGTVETAAGNVPALAVWGVPALLTGVFGAFGVRRPGDLPVNDAQAKADAAWDESRKQTLADVSGLSRQS